MFWFACNVVQSEHVGRKHTRVRRRYTTPLQPLSTLLDQDTRAETHRVLNNACLEQTTRFAILVVVYMSTPRTPGCYMASERGSWESFQPISAQESGDERLVSLLERSPR